MWRKRAEAAKTKSTGTGVLVESHHGGHMARLLVCLALLLAVSGSSSELPLLFMQEEDVFDWWGAQW